MTPEPGDAPVRDTWLPYARQSVTDADVAAVERVLRSDFLTTGPEVDAFEKAVADRVGAAHAVAVASGTAALHTALHALGIGPGDEVIVPPMTFAATANAVLYCGAQPVFADVDADALLLDPASVGERITDRTRALVGVDYAGRACDWDALNALAAEHDLRTVADACHAIGGSLGGRPVGTLADVTCFSFHPVKHVAAGEGGMVVTDDGAVDEVARRFRHHGIRRDAGPAVPGYVMDDLGWNHRMSDIHCALGRSQLDRLDASLERRRALAAAYDAALADIPGVTPLDHGDPTEHAFHLYVVRVDADAFGQDRDAVMAALHADNIGAGLHYPCVHLHAWHREHLGTGPGLCPTAEAAAEAILTLPLFPAMTDDDQGDVIAALRRAGEAARG